MESFLELFSRLGFPAGVAAVLLWFAWHVSKALLSAHTSFLEAMKESNRRNTETLDGIHRILSNQDMHLEKQADALNALASSNTVLANSLDDIRRQLQLRT
jgi:hypothetical protein